MINESPPCLSAERGFVFSNHPKQADFYMTFLLVNFAVKNATVFFPFLLSRTGLTISVSLLPISDAVHCNRPCSAVQPLLQCTASVLAVHCILHTHMQPFPQVLATIPARTCNRPCKYLREKTPLFRISSSSPTISLLCLLAYCRAGSRELRVGIICHADGCQEG